MNPSLFERHFPKNGAKISIQEKFLLYEIVKVNTMQQESPRKMVAKFPFICNENVR
jgi:hypothetical protein